MHAHIPECERRISPANPRRMRRAHEIGSLPPAHLVGADEIRAGDGDPQISGPQGEPALAWEEVRGQSKKAIGELGRLHWYEVS